MTPTKENFNRTNAKSFLSSISYDEGSGNIILWYAPEPNKEEVLGFTYNPWIEFDSELSALAADLSNDEVYAYALREFKE